jgi:hypothetical protein
MGAYFQKGLYDYPDHCLFCSNVLPDGSSSSSCFIRSYCHPSENLGLLHLSHHIYVTKEHYILLFHDYLPHLLVDYHIMRHRIPMPVCLGRFPHTSCLVFPIADKNIRPIQSYWDSSVHSEYCINSYAFNIITGVLNSLSDFLVYLWPAQYLWTLRLPLKQKIGVLSLFVTGCG